MSRSKLKTTVYLFAHVALGLLMILGKLLGIVKWPWAIVLTPIWVWPAALLLTGSFVLCAVGTIEFIQHYRKRRGKINHA